MSEEEAFKTQLDLESQTVLVNILANTIKENERMSLVKQENASEDSNKDDQNLASQIDIQKRHLDLLKKRNEELVKETENVKTLYNKKTQKVQEAYKKLVGEKDIIRQKKEMNIQQYKKKIEDIKNEEAAIDNEMQTILGQIGQLRVRNIIQRSGGTWSSTCNRMFEETQYLLNVYEPTSKQNEKIVNIQKELYYKDLDLPFIVPQSNTENEQQQQQFNAFPISPKRQQQPQPQIFPTVISSSQQNSQQQPQPQSQKPQILQQQIVHLQPFVQPQQQPSQYIPSNYQNVRHQVSLPPQSVPIQANVQIQQPYNPSGVPCIVPQYYRAQPMSQIHQQQIQPQIQPQIQVQHAIPHVIPQTMPQQMPQKLHAQAVPIHQNITTPKQTQNPKPRIRMKKLGPLKRK